MCGPALNGKKMNGFGMWCLCRRSIRLRQVRWEHEKVCVSLSDASRQALAVGSPQILPTVHQEEAVHGSADRGQMGWPGGSARLTSCLAEYKKGFRRSLPARPAPQNITCKAVKTSIWDERNVSYLTFKGLNKRRISHYPSARIVWEMTYMGG